MGISKGYVSGYFNHHPVRNSPGFKVNILIDNNGHACLAGFNHLTVATDPSTITSLTVTGAGGAVRWMSPERLNPKSSGGYPTIESDCYALGMVIYEVLSGQMPYAQCSPPDATWKILNGEHPSKPQGAEGAWFTTGLWGMLELCWNRQPGDRPTLNVVLRYLQDVTQPSRLPGGRSNNTGRNSSLFSSFLSRLY